MALGEEEVVAGAGTLGRLAAGNRWSGGERKHDQDVELCKGGAESADEL